MQGAIRSLVVYEVLMYKERLGSRTEVRQRFLPRRNCVVGLKLGAQIATKHPWSTARTPLCALLESIHADFRNHCKIALPPPAVRNQAETTAGVRFSREPCLNLNMNAIL